MKTVQLFEDNYMASLRCPSLEFVMQKKLTLSINAEIYEALHKMAGKRKIGRFIENLVRPYLASDGLQEKTAQDADQEPSILPWTKTADANAEKAY
jgi:hypothetical protein